MCFCNVERARGWSEQECESLSLRNFRMNVQKGPVNGNQIPPLLPALDCPKVCDHEIACDQRSCFDEDANRWWVNVGKVGLDSEEKEEQQASQSKNPKSGASSWVTCLSPSSGNRTVAQTQGKKRSKSTIQIGSRFQSRQLWKARKAQPTQCVGR